MCLFIVFEVEPLTSTSIYFHSPSPIPSPFSLPDGCPIRSTSRPVLANHTTSRPGGGVKKVTGVGGTTYEISVWAKGFLHGLSRREGEKVFGLLLLTWAGYYSWLQDSEKQLSLQQWTPGAGPCGTHFGIFVSFWPFFSASFSDLNKE